MLSLEVFDHHQSDEVNQSIFTLGTTSKESCFDNAISKRQVLTVPNAANRELNA